jgi:hypothetical protein
VQDGAHLVGGQIQVCATIITLYKPVPITVAQGYAFNFFWQAARLRGSFDIKS